MYNKNIGRSLCRRRPVCRPEPAGLPAGVGRSLCRRRPVSMPASAGLYAGVWALWAPGALGPTPFRLCRRTLFVSGFCASQQIKKCLFKKLGVCFETFAILANIDLNLRLKICKIAIQSSVRTFTYPFVPKRRVSKSQYERIPLTFFCVNIVD